ncbi:hypothetical protein MVEN_00682300 [Mycena venus]|uniref:Uncharacterized protein n=1 Tax=Mycena venus TaxID=2733690 RepID=A0A8H6YJS2_9AGAR|nr:hypothetical protein MVEN_00682300 [Mycena venus]
MARRMPLEQSETQRRMPPPEELETQLDDNFPLFDTALSCDIGLVSFDATVNADVDLDSQMNIGFAFLMNSTVAPSAIDNFGLAAAVSGYAKGIINIRSLLSGDVDSGNIPVFKAGIPGLSFPCLLTLGPEAAINVRAGAGFDVNTDIAVPITWSFPLLDFWTKLTTFSHCVPLPTVNAPHSTNIKEGFNKTASPRLCYTTVHDPIQPAFNAFTSATVALYAELASSAEIG